MVQRSGRSKSKTKSGFTLVELLVVIGIIALLISILLPALNKANRAAKVVYCESNLKSLLNAMHIYADANNGYLPGSPVTTGFGANQVSFTAGTAGEPDIMQNWDWQTPLYRAMGSNIAPLTSDNDRFTRYIKFAAMGIFSCPEATSYTSAPYGTAATTSLPSSFPMPSYMTALAFLITPDYGNQGYMKTGTMGFTLPDGYAPRLNKVGNWSLKIYVCDGAKFTAPGTPLDTEMSYNANQDSEGGAFSDIGSYGASNPQGTVTAPQALNRAAAQSTYLPVYPNPDPRVFGYRHGYSKPLGRSDSYKFNAGFFDGHVETLGDLESSNPIFWIPKGSYISPQNIEPDTVSHFGINLLSPRFSINQ